jgi:hypothetical protein
MSAWQIENSRLGRSQSTIEDIDRALHGAAPAHSSHKIARSVVAVSAELHTAYGHEQHESVQNIIDGITSTVEGIDSERHVEFDEREEY